LRPPREAATRAWMPSRTTANPGRNRLDGAGAWTLLFGEFEIAQILESAGAKRDDYNSGDGKGVSLIHG
jgi:hypothetical protein